MQILAAVDIFLMYLLPSCVLIACYWRIIMVIRQRKIHVGHSTTTKSFTVSTNIDATSGQQAGPSFVSQNDSSADTINSANNAPTMISHTQMNVLQTMIIIATSFVILWMPGATTILLVYFEVSLFSLHR
jgi:hypothetical protein